MSLRKLAASLLRTASSGSRAFRYGRPESLHFRAPSSQLVSPRGIVDQGFRGQLLSQHRPAFNSSSCNWFRFSSSASPQSNDKETVKSGNGQEKGSDTHQTEASASSESKMKGTAESGNGSENQGKGAGVAESSSEGTSESDSESDLTRDDLVKLVEEKEQLLLLKQEELTQMKDKILRSYAEMENVMERTRRESENAKKFAIQNFAKGLLDVADNLGRASSAAKESFSKIDASKDTTGAVQQLKTLLEGVEMTEKQLTEVFKKFGLEKYNPVDEEFDPNRHNAVFQVPDASKPAGQVAVVLKAGYILHGRVVRPAEVGVTVAVDNEEAGKDPEA
ncbi:grpE protein homolog 2, mitochondrial-like [Andrographis paniculata]|uniref:grpE protein homolog 2, mitochondrial-like n=1 Tax=Andrographis paniculata TaxID=175694 RepID=UPI0021E81491|nr:grpE protein homolog 2, mitochondrial-like [Andrographis paniculata]XP_051133540.1 grpE protein homolog 2, mitochondrial-like [Andrographis paniculata]XP_051133541.1 grpE protein homolog 2, mitochondrial-like [Andrographis paniculata]